MHLEQEFLVTHAALNLLPRTKKSEVRRDRTRSKAFCPRVSSREWRGFLEKGGSLWPPGAAVTTDRPQHMLRSGPHVCHLRPVRASSRISWQRPPPSIQLYKRNPGGVPFLIAPRNPRCPQSPLIVPPACHSDVTLAVVPFSSSVCHICFLFLSSSL